MARFKTLPLEKVIRRAPLALRFIDQARNEQVNTGLTVLAWRLGTTTPLYEAFRSPQSGIYGYSTLPGFRRFEPEDATATQQDTFDYAIYVRDNMERFLPQTLVMTLPKNQIIPVALLPSPSCPASPDLVVIYGQLKDASNNSDAQWALFTAKISGGADKYSTMADKRGMFALHLPFAATFPKHPENGGNAGQGDRNGNSPKRLNDLTWELTITVNYKPASQKIIDSSISDLPPTAKSILEEQSVAKIIDSADSTPGAAITRTLHFKQPLVVATTGFSELLIEPEV